MPDLKQLCQDVCELSIQTGDMILKGRDAIRRGEIETKGKNDFVTSVDKASEKMIVEMLEKLLPEAGFIAEEQTSTKKGHTYNWVIDPLDGTTNFIHGIPTFCTSIALLKDKKPVLGVVYEINQHECFYSWEDSPCYLNDAEIKVSERKTLAESLILTGFPYTDFSRMEGYMNFFMYLMKNTHGLRRPGSAAADLAYVAAGRAEAFYEYGLKPWDVAAGVFLIQQAGGKVTDFKGGDDFIFGEELVSGNAMVFQEFLKKLQEFF
jgi:myo-inositol-1(or 4)-monophosphatase